MKEILERIVNKYNEETKGTNIQIHETSCVGGWNKLALVEHLQNRDNVGELISTEFKDTNSILGVSITFKELDYTNLLIDSMVDLLLFKYDKTRSS